MVGSILVCDDHAHVIGGGVEVIERAGTA